MIQKSATGSSKQKTKLKDTLETLRDTGSGRSSVFDQFFGSYDNDEYGDFENFGLPARRKEQAKPKQEFKVFNYNEYYERELVKRQIKELTEQVKKEIELIKKADSSLLQEVKDIQKLTVEQLPEKPGIYHVRFLELILSILRTLRAKIGESKTWLQALMSKKKKRGSLFVARSKKQGTQYSLSQEISTARNVQ